MTERATVLLAATLAAAARHAGGLSVVPASETRVPSLLALAPVPALIAALLALAARRWFCPSRRFACILTSMLPGALLLGVAALLWIVGGAYASDHLRGDPCRTASRVVAADADAAASASSSLPIW